MDVHHSDNDDLASAVSSAAQQLGLGSIGAHHSAHQYHHQLHPHDFLTKSDDDDGLDRDHDVDVDGLDIPIIDDGMDDDLDLQFDVGTPTRSTSFGRPPSIRKACDLCHAAKQKCSGERPSCNRCVTGGWQCVYAPRQRRRTVPKPKETSVALIDPDLPSVELPITLDSTPVPIGKKRKLGRRDSDTQYESPGIDMKEAMGMALDLGLGVEEDNEEMLSMSDEAMLESIAIDGYLADLPLGTFVRNLPEPPPPPEPEHPTFSVDDLGVSTADMDQHTTSALRDAIFSLNESSGVTVNHVDGGGEGDQHGDGEDGQGLDPHLALLDLSQAMPDDSHTQVDHHNTHHFSGCSHRPLVPHILTLLTQHPLEPKPGSNTPLTLAVFAPLARSLRLFHSLAHCSICSSAPGDTLPQLALLSRTTTILTFPFPPINSSLGSSAQITLHGARLTGTGLSDAIEQHIVGVVWDSWRASVREIFAVFERKAQDVIQQSAAAAATNRNNNEPHSTSSPDTQRAGLVFQAMTRLVTAMDEVEGN